MCEEIALALPFIMHTICITYSGHMKIMATNCGANYFVKWLSIYDPTSQRDDGMNRKEFKEEDFLFV